MLDVCQNKLIALIISNRLHVKSIAQVMLVNGTILNVGKILHLHVQILVVLHLMILIVKQTYINAKQILVLQLVYQKFVNIRLKINNLGELLFQQLPIVQLLILLVQLI
jgi:hypothetical protein